MSDTLPETALTNVALATRHCSSAGDRIRTFTYSMDLWDDMLCNKAGPVEGKECQKSLILHYNG